MQRAVRAAIWRRSSATAAAQYDDDDDGEDWFSYTSKAPDCNTAGPGNIRSDCPWPDKTSGVFARSTWAASLDEIRDGTSNTIAMGEVRGWCSGLSVATRLGEERRAVVRHHRADQLSHLPRRERRRQRSQLRRHRLQQQRELVEHQHGFQVAASRRARMFVFCDGSVHFLSESIDHTDLSNAGRSPRWRRVVGRRVISGHSSIQHALFLLI